MAGARCPPVCSLPRRPRQPRAAGDEVAATAATWLPAPTAPPEPDAEGGRAGYVRNLPAAYQRIRQTRRYAPSGRQRGNWTEESIRSAIDTAKQHGLVAYNAMINLPASVIYGRESRAKDMEPFLASIQAAGKAGLPVVEYNFYAHRAIEGYYETVGRANSGYTGFDYDLELLIDQNGRVVQPIYRDASRPDHRRDPGGFPQRPEGKVPDLPPLENEGAHNLQEMWANATYFLKAVIPVAEKAGVRMALHPNDPPAPISRGSAADHGHGGGLEAFN